MVEFTTNATRIAQLCYYDESLNSWIPVSSGDPLPVSGVVSITGGGSSGTIEAVVVEHAIDTSDYDLNSSAFSFSTNIIYDYILDSLELNFTSEAFKTVTISSSDGTILWGGSLDTSLNNLGYNTPAKSINLLFNQAFNANENITVGVTQTTIPCLMDCVLKIKRGSALSPEGIKFLDPDNSAYGIARVGNRPRVSSVDYTIDIATGNIANHTVLRGFGERESVAVVTNGDDVWRGTNTTIPIPSSAGEQMTIVSSSPQDSSANTGVRAVEIHYLDSTGNVQIENIFLNGTTTINTMATNITFVNELHATDVGTNGVAVGDITIYKIGEATRVYNLIKAGGNMSLSCIRKIPSGMKYFISSFSASCTGNKPTAVRLRSTSHETTVYDSSNPVFLFKDSAYLGEASDSKSYLPPIFIPGGTVIKATVWATQAGGNVSAAFNGWYEPA